MALSELAKGPIHGSYLAISLLGQLSQQGLEQLLGILEGRRSCLAHLGRNEPEFKP